MDQVNTRGYSSRKDAPPDILPHWDIRVGCTKGRWTAAAYPNRLEYDTKTCVLRPKKQKKRKAGSDKPCAAAPPPPQDEIDKRWDAVWGTLAKSFKMLTDSDAPEDLLMRPDSDEGVVCRKVFAHAAILEAVSDGVEKGRSALSRVGIDVVCPSLLSEDATMEGVPSREIPEDIEVGLDPDGSETTFTFHSIRTKVGSIEDAAWIRQFGGTKISLETAGLLGEAAVRFDYILMCDMHAGTWCPKEVFAERARTFYERAQAVYALPWAADRVPLQEDDPPEPLRIAQGPAGDADVADDVYGFDVFGREHEVVDNDVDYEYVPPTDGCADDDDTESIDETDLLY